MCTFVLYVLFRLLEEGKNNNNKRKSGNIFIRISISTWIRLRKVRDRFRKIGFLCAEAAFAMEYLEEMEAFVISPLAFHAHSNNANNNSSIYDSRNRFLNLIYGNAERTGNRSTSRLRFQDILEQQNWKTVIYFA